ncbi:non-ribosomal peptide synthetase, partial [Paenibacillus sp. 22594]|uniref:non-ribosomal peptide synthetase n=1 Tax=Paenibacillus sp. 22594 TaxID=3453947 RepID=UPI003F85D458
LRVHHVVLSNDSYQLIWNFHHIIMDGWSLGTLFGELLYIYKTLSLGQALQLETPQPYGRFIVWLESQDKNQGATYWKNYLHNVDDVTLLPGYQKQNGQNLYVQEEQCLTLSREMTEKLQRTAAQQQVTLNTVLQAIWGVLLQKYNQRKEVVFGAVVSGRPGEIPGIEKMVGLFINTIPVRMSGSSQTFVELVQSIQDEATLSDQYSSYPLYEIQNHSVLKQDLINHIVVFENYPIDERLKNMSKGDGEAILELSGFQTFEQTNYDFNVVVIPGAELMIKFSYNSQAYSEEAVKRIRGHVEHLIEQVVTAPEQGLEELEIVTAAEKEQLIFGFNQTAAAYPAAKTVHQLFEEQAKRTPDHIALVEKEKVMSYRVLNEKANQLGRYLQQCGVTNNTVVGIMAERSMELVIGLLAVLKTGGTYVPIDPAVPVERIKYILEDSGAKVLLTQANLGAEEVGSKVWVELNQPVAHLGIHNLEDVQPSAESLAYIMYTSGSTGQPKGVMISHRGVVNYLEGARKAYYSEKAYDGALYSSIAFDLTVTSLYLPLLTGQKLFIYNEQDPAVVLEEVLRADQAGMLKVTPSHLELVARMSVKSQHLRVLIVGGEELKTELAERIYDHYEGRVRLYNEYGPTEATVGCMVHPYDPAIEQSGTVRIGKPGDNMEIYILEHGTDLVPIGVYGELCIGGDGLARGYLNRAELTAEKFVDHPFSEGEKLYRSGDLARWLTDGTMEYGGRMDHQVKIRGYRIECGEIEAQLQAHEQVKEAVVLARKEASGQQYLCAYVVGDAESEELRGYLAQTLPGYMIPAHVVRLEQMPLTHNGKVDRNALPIPEHHLMQNEYVAPQGEIEEQLAAIWCEVLGAKQVGRTDSFFELGGDSIKAIRIVSKLRSAGYHIAIKDIMQKYTVEAISYVVQKSILEEQYEQSEVSGLVPQTPIVREFTSWKFPKPHHFNQDMLMEIDLEEENQLREVLDALTAHHDILRSVYREGQLEILKVSDSKAYELKVYDYSKEQTAVELMEAACTDLHR